MRYCGHVCLPNISSLLLVTGPISLKKFPLLQIVLVGRPLAAAYLSAWQLHIIPDPTGHDNWPRFRHVLKPGQTGSSLGSYLYKEVRRTQLFFSLRFLSRS